MKAVGYVRVSTSEQAQHGWNLNEDRKLIEERCQREGWELVAVHDDAARQGDDPDRPGLAALVNSLDEIDVVIMRAQDRISRDIGIWAMVSTALRAAGVRVETFTGPIDLESASGEFMANVMASVGKFEKRRTGERVRQALGARAKAGLHTGSAAPYGYRWEDKLLVAVDDEKAIVQRIFSDYLKGCSQRAITRALNDELVPLRSTTSWQQSAVARILANVLYAGKLPFKGEVLDGQHEALVSQTTFDRAQTERARRGAQKAGRHPDGGHLLVGGLLRCTCGAGMLTRKARTGVERARYVCGRRIEQGAFSCDQPSIRRELVDEPFLAHLLDGYVDVEATVLRIEERASSARDGAGEAARRAEAEVVKVEQAIATTERDYDAGVIDGRQYAKREARLTEELGAAKGELEQARNHAVLAVQPAGDAEQAVLDHLAAIKQAVAGAGENAPDLAALRNVISHMFASVELIEHGSFGQALPHARGVVAYPSGVDKDPQVKDKERRYCLLPKLRFEAVDMATFTPVGQELPISDLNTFLWRYCWW